MNLALKYVGMVGLLIGVGLVLSNPSGFNTVITSLSKGQADIIKALQFR